MAKLFNTDGWGKVYIFDTKYKLMPELNPKAHTRTRFWYIIPKDAKLEGL